VVLIITYLSTDDRRLYVDSNGPRFSLDRSGPWALLLPVLMQWSAIGGRGNVQRDRGRTDRSNA
jgi:hypothetical protein